MKWKKVIFNLLIIFGLITIVIFYIPSSNEMQESKNTLAIGKLDNMQHEDIVKKLNESRVGDADYSLTTAIEASYSDYNTYYADKLYALLDSSKLKNKCRQIEQSTIKEQVKKNNQDIFNEIEKIFTTVDLAETCNSVNKKQITDQVREISNDTYQKKEGFFLANEMERFKNDEDYIGVKLNSTYMMVSLLVKYDKVDQSMKKEIIDWLLSLDKSSSPQRKFYINSIMTSLGEPALSKQFSITKPELPNTLDLNSAVELSFYAKVSPLQEKEKEEIVSLLEQNQKVQVENMQYLYRLIETYQSLGKEPPKSFAEELLNEMSVYNQKGNFPMITKYQPDYTQMFMSIAVLSALKQEQAIDWNAISSDLKALTYEEVKDLEIYQKLSIVSMDNLADPDYQLTADLRTKLKGSLKNKAYDNFQRDNVMEWSFTLHSLRGLGYQLEQENMPAEIKEGLQEIYEERKFMGKDLDLVALIFADTIAQAGLYEEEVKKAVKELASLDTKPEMDLAAEYIFFKYSLMKKAGIPFSEEQQQKEIDALKRNGGYTRSDANHFMDLRSTYLLIQLQAQGEDTYAFR
jgi:hypothetical protein